MGRKMTDKTAILNLINALLFFWLVAHTYIYSRDSDKLLDLKIAEKKLSIQKLKIELSNDR